MKVGIILVLVIMSILTPSFSFGADSSLEFGTRFIPSKLVEEKEGMIHVYAKQGSNTVPEKIKGLTVTSLDSSILRVLTVKESDTGFVSEVVVKGIKAGETKIFLAAPGFSSVELPVKVYGNVFNQEQLLVKAVPDSFSSDGPFRGIVSVELADVDGFPVKATEDVQVSLNVANNNMLDIFQKDLVIKKGEYFTGTQFTVKESGTTGKTNIFATGENMKAKSNDIMVDVNEDDLEIKLYVFPKDQINVFGQGAVGHIIVQLQKEGNEEPVLATRDIQVKYKVTNDIFTNQNSSPNSQIGESTGTITIKKGSYWGYDTFTLLGAQTGEYIVTITSGNPVTLDTETVQATFYTQNVPNALPNEGDRFVKFEAVPVFATGNKELLGVVHLEDTSDNPILADKNLEIQFDSTDNDFVSIDDTFLEQGTGSALVFGHVGHSIPDDISEELEIVPVVEVEDKSAKPVETEVFGPDEETHKLVAEPLIDKVLANTEFPIVVYLIDDDEVTKFPKNSNLFVSPSDIFDVESKQILSGDDIVMLNTKAKDKGKDTLQFTVIDVEDVEVTIESLSQKPANIIIDHSETIYTGSNDVFSVQLLNSQGLPVFATEDIEINFVVNDESLLQIPKSVIIEKGEYFTIFDAGPRSSGITEISALAEGLQISKTELEIKNLKPALLLDVPEIIESGEVFTAKVSVNQDELPLPNMKVNWNIDGGVLQLSDKKTSPTGEAIASIISTSDQKIDVQASVSGSYYSPNAITKTVRVNATSEFTAFAEGEQDIQEFEKFEIGGIDPVIIIVPAGIALLGYMLFKQGSIRIKKPVESKPIQE